MFRRQQILEQDQSDDELLSESDVDYKLIISNTLRYMQIYLK